MTRPIYLGFCLMCRKTKDFQKTVFLRCDVQSFRCPSRTNCSDGESLNMLKFLFLSCLGFFSILPYLPESSFQKCICLTLTLSFKPSLSVLPVFNFLSLCYCHFSPLSVSLPLPFPLLLISVILQLCQPGP